MKDIKKYYLYITVFITGAVILILEILGTRIIAPYYGTTLYVWSSLITVTLVALSLGYFIGGKLADKKPELNVMYLIIFFAGIFILLIPLISSFVLTKTNSLGSTWGVLISSVILFTVPLFLLGMIAPYAIKLKATELRTVGVTAGSLYAVATIGSFVGAILTGFFLIPNFGIRSIIYLMSISLFFISCAWFFIRKKYNFIIITIMLSLLFFLFPQIIASNPDLEIIYETESPYTKLKVVDEFNTYRYLLVDGTTQTRYDIKEKEFMLAYLKLFEKAINYHPNPKDVLVIGLGGGGIDKQLENYNLNIDNVEIDPKIAEIARAYFDFKGNVIIDDGRHYIRNIDKKYDIVFLDAYNGYSIYPYLFSEEAFLEIKNILNDDGILAINSIGYENYLSTDDKLISSIYKTLKQVFPNVYVKSKGYGLTNFVFYATDSELELDNQFISVSIDETNCIILTDNYNPIESFAVKTIEEWRSLNIERFGNVII